MRTQNRPVGLLDILGIQSSGDVPQDVMSDIILSVEMRDLYLLSRAETNFQLTTGYASTAKSWDTVTHSSFVVPSGFMRYLLNYSAYVYGLTNQIVDIGQLWIGLPTGGGVYQQCGVKTNTDATPSASQPGNAGLGASLALDRPVFIPPNGTFGCNGRVVQSAAATTYNVQHVARWVDLKI